MKTNVNSQKLKQLREQRGWSQEQLSDMAKISLRTLQRVEKDSGCSMETVKSLASVFELDFKELLIEKDSKKFDGVDFLLRIEHGKQIFDLLGGKHAGDCDFDKAITDRNVLELVNNLFQTVMDYNDIWDDIEYGGRTEAIIYFQELVDKLHENNLWLFGGVTKREQRSVQPPIIFDVIVLRVHPSNSPTIIKVDLEKANVSTASMK